jgi:hypothetical protein
MSGAFSGLAGKSSLSLMLSAPMAEILKGGHLVVLLCRPSAGLAAGWQCGGFHGRGKLRARQEEQHLDAYYTTRYSRISFHISRKSTEQCMSVCYPTDRKATVGASLFKTAPPPGGRQCFKDPTRQDISEATIALLCQVHAVCSHR